MTPIFSDTNALRAGVGFTPHLTKLIDDTIASFTRDQSLRPSLIKLRFPAELEAVYEIDTKHARVQELRVTVSASIILMVLITVTDGTFVPDMRWGGLLIRLVASLVLGASVLTFHRFSGPRRELLLCAVAYVAILALVSVPLLSKAAEAPYGLFVWIFALIYCNTTTPLRFRNALPFSVLCVVTTVILTPISGRINAGLSDALTFLAIVGAVFSLIANYRMEKSVRLSYLLASKEALRLAVLNRNCDQLETMSNTDALTGLSNRGHFDRSLDTLFAGCATPGVRVGLILIDVDHFKRYNDYYGHPAGDACLRSIGAVITHVMRGYKDFGFRYGGEEFGALLLDVSGDTTQGIAETIRAQVERQGIEHLNRGDGCKLVTISVGVSSAKIGDGGTAKELVMNADASLYAAKQGGRNQIRYALRDHSAARTGREDHVFKVSA